MSTVLWANHLLEGQVVSDQSDKGALYRHADKLDKLAAAAKLSPFSSLFDQTDLQFNLGEDELPDGMESTNELMARNGNWVAAADALAILAGLHASITDTRPRFGLLSNDYDAVVAELEEAIGFAKAAAESGARFNFAVVT